MKLLFAIFLLVALAGCETERDAVTGDATDAMESTDRPAGSRETGQSQSPGTPADSSRTETQSGAPTTPGEGGDELHAVAEIMPTEGNEARGTIRLSGGNGTIRVAGTITGLQPGAHGLHIHEVGNCSAPDASSTGEHFNPHDDPHGSPRDLDDAHHVGDLGNITANEEGEAEVNIEDAEMLLSGAESVIGKALVVHSDQDDFATQPSGNSGAPVGCGEIEETAQQQAGVGT